MYIQSALKFSAGSKEKDNKTEKRLATLFYHILEFPRPWDHQVLEVGRVLHPDDQQLQDLMPSCFLVLLRGMSAFHSSMAALLSASEKGSTHCGMLAVDWGTNAKKYLTFIVRDGHGGGWSRKINARYLHTLMVYL